MPLNWPDSPSPGDQYTDEGKTWEWDGTVWFIPNTAGGLPPITPTADQGKALVINGSDAAEWGAEVDNDNQVINGGQF